MLPQDETERLLRGRCADSAGRFLGVPVDGGAAGSRGGRPFGRVAAGRKAFESTVRGGLRRCEQLDPGVGRHPLRRRDVPGAFRALGRTHGLATAGRRGAALLLSRRARRGHPVPGECRHRIVTTVDEAPPEPSLSDVQALLDARGPRMSRPRRGSPLGPPFPGQPQAGRPLPRRCNLPRGRRRARARPRGRARHEHWYPGRSEPRMEAGPRAQRASPRFASGFLRAGAEDGTLPFSLTVAW